jgi:hypothetical protein
MAAVLDGERCRHVEAKVSSGRPPGRHQGAQVCVHTTHGRTRPARSSA